MIVYNILVSIRILRRHTRNENMSMVSTLPQGDDTWDVVVHFVQMKSTARHNGKLYFHVAAHRSRVYKV